MIFKIFHVFIVFILIMSVSNLFSNIISFRNINWLTELSSYYIFEPSNQLNQFFANKYPNIKMNGEFTSHMAFSEFLGELQEKYNCDILSYSMLDVYKDDKMKVITYVRNNEYKSAYTIPERMIKEGRCYQGNENELILIQGDLYDVGDTIYLKNTDGKQVGFKVVGRTKDACFMNNASPALGIETMIQNSRNSNYNTVFLMNPLCDFNDVEHYFISSNSVLIQTDNAILIKELGEKGEISKIEYYLNKSKGDFIFSFMLFLVAFIVYLISSYIIFINEWKENIAIWLIAAGIIGFIVSSIMILTPTYTWIRGITVIITILIPYMISRKKENSYCTKILTENQLRDIKNE